MFAAHRPGVHLSVWGGGGGGGQQASCLVAKQAMEFPQVQAMCASN